MSRDRRKWAHDEWHTDSSGSVIGGAPANFVLVAKTALKAAEAELAEQKGGRMSREAFWWYVICAFFLGVVVTGFVLSVTR